MQSKHTKRESPKSKRKKGLIASALLVALILIPLNWYTVEFSMGIAETFEVPVDNPEHQILIATQGSEYKDALVAKLTQQLNTRRAYIKVIDVSGLSRTEPEVWDALVILHTWENFQPQADAKQFLDRLEVSSMQKIVVLTTSGAGTSKMESIDAITSASEISDIKTVTAKIMQRLDLALKN